MEITNQDIIAGTTLEWEEYFDDFPSSDYDSECALKKGSGSPLIIEATASTETTNGFKLTVIDEDNHTASVEMESAKELAKNEETVIPNLEKNLAKNGNTPFIVDDLKIELSANWFFPISKINELRREVLDLLIETRLNEYHREEFQITKTNHPYPVTTLDFTYNVSNKLARKFYERHGVTEIEKAFELQWDPGKSRVMTTKYCVKYELGKCSKYQRDTMGTKVKEP